MDGLNNERKKLQEDMLQETDAQIDTSKDLLRVASEQFHE